MTAATKKPCVLPPPQSVHILPPLNRRGEVDVKVG